MEIIKKLMLSLVLVVSVATANTEHLANLLGHFAPPIYRNPYFHFSLAIPMTWHYQSPQAMSLLNLQPGQQLNLFQISSLTMTSVVHPMIKAFVIYLGVTSKKVSAKDHIASVATVLREHPNVVVYDNLPPVYIGGERFAQMGVVNTLANEKVYEKLYALIEGDYVINLQLMASTQQDLYEARQVLNTLRFY